ncbi:MAG: hypothetical protein KME46_33885 [Brasilonema angustatum HA4187-MV1]|nr:hypothetical protein [Brasilonema angustatum HA4187-MV1]
MNQPERMSVINWFIRQQDVNRFNQFLSDNRSRLLASFKIILGCHSPLR